MSTTEANTNWKALAKQLGQADPAHEPAGANAPQSEAEPAVNASAGDNHGWRAVAARINAESVGSERVLLRD